MRIKRVLALLLMKAMQVFPINRKKVFFSSYQGTAYNSFPRLVSEKIHIVGGYVIVWAINSKDAVPDYVKTVKPESIGEMFHLATSKYWVDNCRKYIWVRKRKQQMYFQTWHGSVCLKVVEKDAVTLDDYYVKRAINDSRMANYILSQCKWRTNNIINSFWYDGNIIEGDTEPFDETTIIQSKERVYKHYHLENDDNLILYAPTFRNGNDLSPYNLNFSALVLSFMERFGGRWKVIFRLHPNIAFLFDSIKQQGNVINGNSYEMMEDLIAATDVLISDYSSCIFSGFKARKRVFLYTPDLDKYTSDERSLYFDITKLPSPLAMNQNELEEKVRLFDEDSYYRAVDSFNNYLGYFDNDGINEICEIICKDKRRSK